MNEQLSTISNAVLGLDRIKVQQPGHERAGPGQSQVSFQNVLQKEMRTAQDVRFSAHAQQRIASRDINLDTVEVSRIGSAIDRAAAKGARNSLVLADDYALIVNVPNRMVVTAMQREQMSERIVTNIDSTVFLS